MYKIEFKKRAIDDLKTLPTKDKKRIFTKISALQTGLIGDIKKLTLYSPEYRLRIGKYRILFDINGELITIYRVKLRKDAYR